MLRFAFLAIIASVSAISVRADNSTAVLDHVSTFVSTGGDKNFTFAMNIPRVPGSLDDFRFHISGPWGNSWIAVGFGKEMKGSLMLIVYPDATDKNFTVSPRIATGHSEPIPDHNLNYTVVTSNSGIFDNVYVVSGICHSCRSWDGGSIDFESKSQPMIYAIGPGEKLESNSIDAGLRRHEYYGSFTMDMLAATGDGANFPGNVTQMSNATVVGGVTNDHDYASALHALAMCGAFVILFPLGVSFLRILENVRFHWMTQALGVTGVIIGSGLGLSLSSMYNRSKNYNSAHQIIGIAVVVLILVQTSLGGVHHRMFKKTQGGPTIMSKIHRILGPPVILLGIINGAFGLNFAGAGASRQIIAYISIAVVVLVVLAAAVFIKSRRRNRSGAYNTPAAQNFRQAYVTPQFQNDSYITPQHHNDIPLEYGGAQPPRSPGYSRPLG